ncbi:hypothetical protein GCM10009777_28370 [Microbacterium pumilum]|uniref:Uncharacterized protein n=1 Tax=Microbacterium pumilum TaxID=344165 RepID=A0ABN2SRJ6_9MICO
MGAKRPPTATKQLSGTAKKAVHGKKNSGAARRPTDRARPVRATTPPAEAPKTKPGPKPPANSTPTPIPEPVAPASVKPLPQPVSARHSESILGAGYSASIAPRGAATPPEPIEQRAWASRNRTTLFQFVPVLAALVVLAGVVGVILVNVSHSEPVGRASSSVSAAERAAQAWIIDNVDSGQRVLVPDAMTAGIADGRALGVDVVGYDESVAAAAIEAALPSGWRGLDYVVTVAGSVPPSTVSSSARQAVQNSIVVASFGTSAGTVEVHRVVAQGATLASAAERLVAADRLRAGAEIAENPALRISDTDRALLSAGRVDTRIVTVLAALAAGGDVTVAALPAIEGEQGGPIRQVAITDVGGTALASETKMTAAAVTLLDGLRGQFGPDDAEAIDSSLVLTYGLWIDASFD